MVMMGIFADIKKLAAGRLCWGDAITITASLSKLLRIAVTTGCYTLQVSTREEIFLTIPTTTAG